MAGMIGIIIILNVLRYLSGYGFSIPVLVLTFFLAILVIWMWLDSSYTLENQELIIKNGPFRQRVDINEITKIKSSSPSIFKGQLAKYKLTIRHKKNRRLSVFPIDTKTFIKTFLKINPKIKVE